MKRLRIGFLVSSRFAQTTGLVTAVMQALSDAGAVVDVLKPYHGSDGIGVRVVRTVAELEAVRAGRDPILAQRYHAPQGRDRKIYVVGGRLFGVKKVFPIRTEQDRRGEPFTPRPELCEIARRCGRAFGIDLYSVDIIESEGKPYVVDMCSIPGCGGVPDASQLLALYLLTAAERAARGQRLSMAGAQA